MPARPKLLISTRNFAQNPAASVPMDRFNIYVLHQDRAVVESSQPVEVPDAKHERSVRTDRPTLTFRAWYLRHLKGTVAELGSPGARGTEAAAAVSDAAPGCSG